MRVAVVSGSRADYGLLRPTLAALEQDPRFELRLLVTAMHLDRSYGDSLAEIEADGYAIAARVPAGGPVRRRGDFARNLGHATIAFADALAEIEPDILLVLGDRFEILAAALAASDLAVPVAHIHGGELSEGSLDDAVRHCVTKLSALHFVATRAYAERVCQLGEDPEHVHVVGAAGPESIRHLRLLERDALAASLSLEELATPLLALTMHPESLHPQLAAKQAHALTSAVEEVLEGEGRVVITLPNDDPGNAAVREELQSWSGRTANVAVFATLGQLRYLSLLRHADALVGNSSSALIEAPSFGLPVVNVGERQRGRVRAANVVSCPPQRDAIATALRRALDPAFRTSLADLKNPYDHGDMARRVLAVLAGTPLEGLRDKRFFDLEEEPWRARLHLAEAA
jgi:UDP-hydrolysing UDP-N-acetyl-D-glucosamine 2-epimerase